MKTTQPEPYLRSFITPLIAIIIAVLNIESHALLALPFLFLSILIFLALLNPESHGTKCILYYIIKKEIKKNEILSFFLNKIENAKSIESIDNGYCFDNIKAYYDEDKDYCVFSIQHNEETIIYPIDNQYSRFFKNQLKENKKRLADGKIQQKEKAEREAKLHQKQMISLHNSPKIKTALMN